MGERAAAAERGGAARRPDCYEVLLNYACNARCRFCSQGDFDRGETASFDAIAKAVYWARANGYGRLGLSGGEPLLRRDLAKVVALGRGVGFKYIRIQSNGMRFADRALCESLVRAGLTFCKLTFASDDEATHDALIGQSGAWRKSMAGLANLQALRVGIGINILINRRNVGALARTVRFFLDRGVSNFVLIYPLYLGAMRANAAELGVGLPEAAPRVLEALELMESVGLGDKIKVLNMPPCFLRGHERRAMSLYRFNTIVTEPSGRRRDLDDESGGARVQGPPCRSCALKARCPGVAAEGADVWGWEGFRPLRRVPRPGARRAARRSPGPVRYLTDNEKCLLEILRGAPVLDTASVLARAAGLPMCQDCRDGNAVLTAAQRLVSAGMVARTFKSGRYYWSLASAHGAA